MRSLDSSVGIGMGYGLDCCGSIPGKGKMYLFTSSRPAPCPTQPPVQWIPGVKWVVYESDRSPPSYINVKNGGQVELYLHNKENL
jgi:hypothetical protein